MGQSPSISVPPPPGPIRRHVPNSEADHSDRGGRDHTADIPDECLALIFQLLRPTDRKRCSAVCKRWLRVDGESRRRLSLNAKSGLIEAAPSLFARFDSVTNLVLRCDRVSASIDDGALILISLRCVNLTRLKLRGCREITETGMAGFAKNCKLLRKLSCGSCNFGAKGIYAVVEHCTFLEELSIKRLLGVDNDVTATVTAASTESVPVFVDVVPSSLKSICFKELANGMAFAPLLIGSRNLETLKVIRCLGDWDSTLELIGRLNPRLIGVHLEKIQVSDIGLRGISKCLGLESLHIVKTPDCSDLGLIEVAESCQRLKKLHIDGWRTNRIGDNGLVSVAKCCPNLQELVLIAMYPTTKSLAAIASNCSGLERLAFCGVGTVGNAEIECIAARSMALKKLCIKGCPLSSSGIAAFASGCPNLVKLKVRKCRNVSSEVVEWMRERRASLAISFDYYSSEVDGLDGSGSEFGAQESAMALPGDDDASSSNNASNSNRFSMIRSKFGILGGRSFVPCAFRRGANTDEISGDNVS